MCQLTYCNLRDTKFNRLMTYLLTVEGSDRNDDGTGIMCPSGGYWKTKLSAEVISNYGTILSGQITNDSPVPAHIRLATFGIPVEDKNAHPFMGKRFTLMHNGTLQKDGDYKPKHEKGSDSEEFLLELERDAKEHKNLKFHEIFNTTIKKFSGKFAFIIRDENSDYIIRGKTAELWISYVYYGKIKNKKQVPYVGYIVNTSKDVINRSIVKFINLANLLLTDEIINFTEPVLLKEETIYVAEKTDIKIIAETEERAKIVTPTITKSAIVPATESSEKNRRLKAEISDQAKLANKIAEFLSSHCLTEVDLQRMFYIMGELSLLELRESDVTFFIDFQIPKLSASKKIRDRIKTALSGSPFPFSAYHDLDLEYPWMVNFGRKNDDNVILQKIIKYIETRKMASG